MALNEIVLPDGERVKLGNVAPPTGKPKGVWKEFGTTADARLIPRSEWAGLMAQYEPGPSHEFVPPVHNQNGVGQCNCDDTTALIEFCRGMQGLPYVQLSAADLYARINGGSDNGSLLEDAMSEVMTRGVGTAATCGTLWKRGEFKGEAGPAERLRFRVLEVYSCPTFDHCISATFQGFGLSTGVPWYENYTPDADGWLPPGRGQSGGHAIMGFKPANRRNEWGIWHQNSWGKSWGLQGRFVIPESAYQNGSIGGWWATRSCVDEGGIVPAEVV